MTAAVAINAAQLRREEGMEAARRWRVEHRCVPAVGHMPFPDHRTMAEVDHDEFVAMQAEAMVNGVQHDGYPA